jgi:hypothetical protein
MIACALAWFSVGAITFVVGLYVHLQRVSGRLGTVVRATARRQVQTLGGPWPLFWTIALLSFLLPPVALVCCLVGYRRDWQVFRLEGD